MAAKVVLLNGIEVPRAQIEKALEEADRAEKEVIHHMDVVQIGGSRYVVLGLSQLEKVVDSAKNAPEGGVVLLAFDGTRPSYVSWEHKHLSLRHPRHKTIV